jgi:hypothetical protein
MNKLLPSIACSVVYVVALANGFMDVHAMEDPEKIRNSLAANSIALAGSDLPDSAVTWSFGRSIESASEWYLVHEVGLTAQDAGNLRKLLLNINNATIGQEIVEPLADEVCRRISAGDEDVVSLAGLLDQAHDAEIEEYNSRIMEAIHQLGDKAQTKLKEYRDKRMVGKTIWRTNRVGIAIETPEYYLDSLKKMCERRVGKADRIAQRSKRGYEVKVEDKGNGIGIARYVLRGEEGSAPEEDGKK